MASPTCSDGTTELVGEQDIFGNPLDTARMAALEEDGSAWNGGALERRLVGWCQLVGASWAGASWAGASWAGASWAGASWAGASAGPERPGPAPVGPVPSWAGASWAGASWAGAGWAGTYWATDDCS